MKPHLIRLLLAGYGLAALTAYGAGLGLGGSLLTFWAAGPVFVFILGLTPGVNRVFSDSALIAAADAPLDEEMRRWEAELAAWNAQEEFESVNDEEDRPARSA